MVDILNRKLAPFPEETWNFLDEEAREILEMRLNARRVVELVGPSGLETAAVNTGREKKVESTFAGAELSQRDSLNLVEVEVPLKVNRRELEAFARGAKDADSDPVREAAKRAAEIENKAVFFGLPEAGIEGIIPASREEHGSMDLSADSSTAFYSVIFQAREKLFKTGVEGPYHLLLGEKHYNLLHELESACYPLFKKIEQILGTELIFVPELGDSSVLMAAGDDFELFVGKDVSLGYKGHDEEEVELFLFESLTFKVNAPEAAITFE